MIRVSGYRLDARNERPSGARTPPLTGGAADAAAFIWLASCSGEGSVPQWAGPWAIASW
jgi:hypothetical protein